MGDKYYYQEGAIHNDNKQVMNVTVSGKVDVGALIKGFFAKDAEDVQEVPSDETSVKTEIPDIRSGCRIFYREFLKHCQRRGPQLEVAKMLWG